mmetsp:Transcript_30655/g.69831  ORF Transcript_30655/g.69831 Transcript_30655/m.69831 type:complete len:433 (-) Transcript_30655:170-1468(-)
MPSCSHGCLLGGLVVVGLAGRVLHDVRALLLELVAEAQDVEELHGHKQDEAQAPGPQDDEDERHELDGELVPAVAPAVEDAVAAEALLGVAEEAEGHDAPDAASAVHGEGVHDVVHLELLEEHRAALVDQPADEPDQHSLPALHEGAARGDGDEAGQDAVAEAAHVQAPRRDDLCAQEEDDEAAHAGGQRGVRGHQAGEVGVGRSLHAQGAAGVEAEPAEPEEEGPEHAEGDAVAVELLGLGAVPAPLPGADDDGAAEGAHAADEVDDAAAREVLVRRIGADDGAAGMVQEAHTAPAPVGDDGVDDGGHDHHVDAEAQQLGALCHGATHDGRARGAEGALEEPSAERVRRTARRCHVVRLGEACEATELAGILRGPEGEGRAKEVPAEEAPGHDEEVLRQDVLCVLEAHGARLQHAEARVHEEDEHGADEHP